VIVCKSNSRTWKNCGARVAWPRLTTPVTLSDGYFRDKLV
jgi:hypothetical protein